MKKIPDRKRSADSIDPMGATGWVQFEFHETFNPSWQVGRILFDNTAQFTIDAFAFVILASQVFKPK